MADAVDHAASAFEALRAAEGYRRPLQAEHGLGNSLEAVQGVALRGTVYRVGEAVTFALLDVADAIRERNAGDG